MSLSRASPARTREFLWRRTALSAAKYAEMATNPFAFFRGALAVFLRDWNDPDATLRPTRFAAGGARPFGIGDAHIENFGTLRIRGGALRLEPNDFDTADRLPYLWDVRRFAVSMCLAARLANPDEPSARAASAAADRTVVRTAVSAYANAMRALAGGGPRPIVAGGGGNPILDDLFARAQADGAARTELDQFTTVSDGVRKIVRGTPNFMDPGPSTRDLPARARAEVARALAGYLPSLSIPVSVREMVPLDVVQLIGRGIGSLPRLRALALVRGPSTAPEDDLIIELKELPPEGSSPIPSAFEFSEPGARLAAATLAGWSEPAADPLWGTGNWLDLPMQFRTAAAGYKTLRVSRLAGALGTPSAIDGLGAVIAGLIARMHAAPVAGASAAAAIAADIAGDPTGFEDEQTEVAMGYCDRVSSDWDLFKQALTLLGPTLGVVGDPARTPSDELQILFDPATDPHAGSVDSVDPVLGPVSINEIAAIATDFVEILNVTSVAQTVTGYALADAAEDGGPRFEKAVRFAPGTRLGPGSRTVVVGGFGSPSPGPRSGCSSKGVGDGVPCYEASWDISSARGETVYLLAPGDVIADQVRYPGDVTSNAAQSWSRLPDGAGPFAVGMASPGAPNVGP